MKNIFFILLLYIYIIPKTNQNDVISFRFNTFQNNLNKENIKSLYENLEKIYLYSNIKIGEPEFSLEIRISFQTPHFSMLYNEEKINDNNLNNLYDINKSNTFKNISNLNRFYVISNKDVHAEEKFKVNLYDINNKKYKEIILNDFDFVLGLNHYNKINFTKIYYLSIGLQIFTGENKFNFIINIKQLNYIENYIWFFYLEKDKNNNNENETINLENFINKENILLIGDYPHKYKPKEFSEDQIYYIYSTNFLWSIKFKSIYFYKNDTKYGIGKVKQSLYSSNCQINFNDIFIYAPNDYLTLMRNIYFVKYINENICHPFVDDTIYTFYCDKTDNFNINNLKDFPTLYFEHYEFNYTFEFSYKELFAEIDNKYIFLIANVDDGQIDEWFLGRAFLNKYQFFFNPDTKVIGFYNPNILVEKINDEDDNIKKDKNNDSNILSKYLIYVLILSFLLFISIIFGIFYACKSCNNNKKRKRANELDDEFEYFENKKIIN